MDTKEIKKQIIELERKINVKFPDLYVDFLSKINDGDTFEIKNTGICMYSYSDLEERNEGSVLKPSCKPILLST